MILSGIIKTVEKPIPDLHNDEAPLPGRFFQLQYFALIIAERFNTELTFEPNISIFKEKPNYICSSKVKL